MAATVVINPEKGFPLFKEHFWGEKNDGFDVLYQNMKCGLQANRELADCLDKLAYTEQAYSNGLSKVSKHTNNFSKDGTFSPMWSVFRYKMEKLSNLHQQRCQRFQDLSKEVTKYGEELYKRQKTTKDEESGTLEVVQNFQALISSVLKAKESYHSKALDVERLRREHSSQRKVDGAEGKCRAACDEYKSLIEKYNVMRQDFYNKMEVSASHFEAFEVQHLSQMKQFVETYMKAVDSSIVLIDQVQKEFKQQSEELTIESLLSTFVSSKMTGVDKPGVIDYEECDLSSLPPAKPMPEIPAIPNDKETDKGAKKKKPMMKFRSKSAKERTPKDNAKDSESVGSMDRVNTPEPEVDDEGYVIRKDGVPPVTGAGEDGERDSFWSSDEDDSESESGGIRKLHIEIKPMGENGVESKSPIPTAASLEELKESVSGISLVSPSALRKRHTLAKSFSLDHSSRHVHQPAPAPLPPGRGSGQAGSYQDDLIGIDLFGEAAATPFSSASPSSITSSLNKDTNSHPPASSSSSALLSSSLPTSSLFPMSSVVRRRPGSAFEGAGSSSSEESGGGVVRGGGGDVGTVVVRGGGGGDGGAVVVRGGGGGDGAEAARANRRSTGSSEVSWEVFNSPAQPVPPHPTLRRNSGSSRTNTPSPSGAFSSSKAPLSNSLGGGGVSRGEYRSSPEPLRSGTPTMFSGSRGPSPLTLGSGDAIPIAVCFTESVHAKFIGTDENKCAVKCSGDMILSFPTGIINVFNTSNPAPTTLTFKITNTHKLEKLIANPGLVKQDNLQSTEHTRIFSFDMVKLREHLQTQRERNPNASYFNIDIIKYQVRCKSGARSAPLHLVAYWSCGDEHTGLRVDYKYNTPAFATPSALTNINITVPIDGEVDTMEAVPPGTWNKESKRAKWTLTELTRFHEQHGQGSIKAKFELASKGPTIPGCITAQFNSDGHTLSGVDFELLGPGYRISLTKKRFTSGKYIWDCER